MNSEFNVEVSAFEGIFGSSHPDETRRKLGDVALNLDEWDLAGKRLRIDTL